MKIQSPDSDTLLITPTSELDWQLMPDLHSILDMVFNIWERERLREAVVLLQEAYRRGDVQHEDVCRILSSPDPQQQSVVAGAKPNQPGDELMNSNAA